MLHINETLLVSLFIISCNFQGKFLQTTAHNGQLYGLTRDSIETVARDGLACVTHMELEVRLLRYTYQTIIVTVRHMVRERNEKQQPLLRCFAPRNSEPVNSFSSSGRTHIKSRRTLSKQIKHIRKKKYSIYPSRRCTDG